MHLGERIISKLERNKLDARVHLEAFRVHLEARVYLGERGITNLKEINYVLFDDKWEKIT